MTNPQRFAHIALVGLPNSGKSTLVNQLVGEKIAAVSQTPQTTRSRILGVVNRGDCQFAFLDLPGFHKPEHILNRRMMAHVESGIQDADLLLWIVDASDHLGPGERMLAKRLANQPKPVFLLLNKLDLISKSSLMEKALSYARLLDCKALIPVGAKTGENLEELWKVLESHCPEGEWSYEEELFTDQTERQLALEFIREKVLRKTSEEVPHGVAVLIERWIEDGSPDYPEGGEEDGVVIQAQILADRSSHRKILLGAGGSKISDIRQSAQRELRKLLGRPCRLELFIKVKEGWRDREQDLDRLDLH